MKQSQNRLAPRFILGVMLLISALLSAVPTAFADPDLVAHWEFDEGAGSVAGDSSGNGNDGTILGATWTTGQIGSALDFDRDYVSVPDDSSLDISGAITISAWVNLNDSFSQQLVVGKTYTLDYKEGGYVLFFSREREFTDRTFRLIFSKANGTAGTGSGNYGTDTAWDRVASEKNDWETGVWYHVAATWDGTTNPDSLKMYVDGLPDAGHTAAQSTIETNNRPLQIGRILFTFPWGFFYGTIDDIRIYDRALSASEVKQIYNDGMGPKAFDPYPFDGATGVEPNTFLRWWPGRDASSHDVYFGTDYNDVNNANTSSPEYKGNFDVNSFDPGGLEYGTAYYWRIDEVNSSNLWKGDIWSFETDGPIIGLSSTQFQFTAFESGANPANRTLGISNSGIATLYWQISEDCNWLSVEPNSGSSIGEVDDVNLIVDITGLIGGVYDCNIIISDSNAVNNPQIIGINLSIIGPEIGLSATHFEFTAIEGNTNPGARVLSISNSGGGTLNWEIGEDCSWLSLEPNSGNSTGEVDDVNLIVDITGLVGGVYGCDITISDSNATNSPRIVGVNLSVIGPEIGLSATQFEFTAIEGGTNPERQILSISNSGGGTLSWEITNECLWLSVEPNSGSSKGEIDDVNMSADISGLSSGIYTCNLTISDPNASNDPQVVGINLHVGDADGMLYVPSEYLTIQTAIDVAFDGNIVIVEPGTYTGEGNRDIDFLGKAITVRSTDPQEPNIVAATIIDCNGSSGDPHRGFYFHNGEDTNSVVAGFTTKNGYASSGGGIYCGNSSPVVSNCSFISNLASGNSNDKGGGGMYNADSSPMVEGCTFSSNSAEVGGGGMYNARSNPTVDNCTFKDNLANTGGGMASWSSKPTVKGCTFSGNLGCGMFNRSSNTTVEFCTFINNSSGNYGGGIYNYSSNPMVKSCIFTANLAPAGGGICNIYSESTMKDCIFTNNSATGGAGGIYNQSSSPSIQGCIFISNLAKTDGGGMYNDRNSGPMVEGCTFCNNFANQDGGGIYNYNNSSPTVTNSILWADMPSEIYSGSTDSEPIVTYSDVKGGWLGDGNIDDDPCFVNPDINDFHLLPNSPCINAGDPCFLPEPNETDIDGEPRVMLGRVDIGADEFNPFEIDFTVINKRRIGRTLFEYDCVVYLTNVSLFTVSNVELEMVNTPGNMVITDPTVTFGNIEIAPGESAASLDTCTFRMDRSEPTDSSEIIWQSSCNISTLGEQNVSGVSFFPLSIIPGDFDHNNKVNFDDLDILTRQWLAPPDDPSADIAPFPYGDDFVDFLDFAILAQNWLRGVDL